MANKLITHTQFLALLPIATSLVRRPMSANEEEKLAEKIEAGKSDYERAQGQPDAGGITKKAGLDMISAAAKDAARRSKKKRGRT